MAPAVQHMLLTRFNVRTPLAGYTEDRPAGWLDHRIALFERFCAPSVRAQTQEDFQWIFFCDEATPEAYLERIAAADPRIVVELRPPHPPGVSGRSLFDAGRFLRPETEVVLGTRLDSDDALHPGALRRARDQLGRFLETGRPVWIHVPARGFRYDERGGRLYASSDVGSRCFTLFERIGADKPFVGPYAAHARVLLSRVESSEDWEVPAALLVVHEMNAANRLRPDEEEVPLSAAGAFPVRLGPRREVARARHGTTAQQMLLTRFNLRQTGAGYTEGRAATWMDERIELFARFCAPSVTAQTLEDFDWIIFCDEATSEAHQRRIASLDPRIRIELLPPSPPVISGRRHVRPGVDIVIGTRLDNDDALHRDALRRVREHLPRFVESGFGEWLYNPSRGYKLDTRRRRLYESTMPNSPFLSLFERLGTLTAPTGPYAGNHSVLYQRIPSYQDPGLPAWLQVLHGGNVSNKVVPGDTLVPLERLGDDYALEL